jgi:hypothetical protein
VEYPDPEHVDRAPRITRGTLAPAEVSRQRVQKLGRGFISTQPGSDRSELDQGRIVGREFVVPGRDTPALLDLVEKPFDQVARAIQLPAETDSVFAISFRRNVCRRCLLAGPFPDPRIREQRSGRGRISLWLDPGRE